MILLPEDTIAGWNNLLNHHISAEDAADWNTLLKEHSKQTGDWSLFEYRNFGLHDDQQIRCLEALPPSSSMATALRAKHCCLMLTLLIYRRREHNAQNSVAKPASLQLILVFANDFKRRQVLAINDEANPFKPRGRHCTAPLFVRPSRGTVTRDVARRQSLDDNSCNSFEMSTSSLKWYRLSIWPQYRRFNNGTLFATFTCLSTAY